MVGTHFGANRDFKKIQCVKTKNYIKNKSVKSYLAII